MFEMSSDYHEDFRIAMQSIFAGLVDGAFIHLSNTQKEDVNPYFKEFENSISKLYTFGRTTWMIHCISNRFSDYNPIYTYNIYFNEMHSFKNKTVDEFIQIASGRCSSPEYINANKTKLIDILNKIRFNYQDFYHIFYEEVQVILREISFQQVFQVLGEKSIFLFEDLNANDIRNSRYTISSPDDVIFLPQNLEATLTFQSIFIQTYLFPNKLPKMPSGWICSLTNSCLAMGSTIIDVFNQAVKEYLVSYDFDNFKYVFELIPTLYVPILLANYNIIKSDLKNYLRLLVQQNDNIWGTRAFNGLVNDTKLAILCSELSNSTVDTDNFLSHSFPYYCRNFLTQESLMQFDSRDFFLISLEDAKIDFDFVYSYRCFREFLSVFDSTTVTPQIVQSFEKIKSYLQKIDKEICSQVANDLFSLIFLQKDSKYICHAGIAQLLVHTIDEFTDLPLVRQAILSLNTGITGITSADITSYFLGGKNALIKSISERDWETARKIVKTSIMYKDYYDTAVGVYGLVTNDSNFEISQSHINTINLEYGFSSQNALDSLRKSKQIYPHLAEPIDQRISIMKKSNPLYCLDNEFKYAIIKTLVTELDENAYDFLQQRKGEAFADLFSLTSSLSSFIQYINLYSRCLFSGQCKSISLSILQPLRNSLANGFISDAKNLCEVYHINLFEYVIEHFSEFELTKEFVEEYYNEYSLVCSTIASTNFPTMSFSNFSLSKISQNLDYKSDTNVLLSKNTQKFDSNILLSKDVDINLLDDYLYCNSPYSINQTLNKYYNEINEDIIIYVSEFVEAFGEKIDERIKKLRLKKEIEKLSKIGSNEEIIANLASKNKKEALFDFLHAKDTKELFDIAMSNGAGLRRQLIDEFPHYLKYYINMLPDLSSKVSEDDKKFINYFNSLPQKIKETCEKMDKNSLVNYLINDEEYCMNITEKSKDLLTDNDFVTIIKKERNIDDFVKISHRIMRFAKEAIEDTCIFVIEKYIENVNVDSLEKEFFEQTRAIKIIHFLDDFGLESPVFKAFAQILYRSPFSLFGQPYVFKKGSTDVQLILFKLGLDHVFFKLENTFEFDADQYVTAMSVILLKIGFFHEARVYIQNYMKTHPGYDILESLKSSVYISDVSPMMIDNTSFCSPVIRYFIHYSFVNHDVVRVVCITPPENLVAEESFIGLAIYQHVHGVATQKPVRLPTKKNVRIDYIEYCGNFLRSILQMPHSIETFLSYGSYNSALTQLLSDALDDKKAAIRNAINQTIVSNTFKTFLIELNKVDPARMLTQGIWEYLLEFSREKKLHLLLIEIYLSLNNRVEAAHECLEAYKAAESASMQLFFLGSALNNLIEVKYSTENSPLSANDENIIIVAEIQKELCEKALRNGMKKCPDLLSGGELVIEACALCVKLREPALYAKILTIFQPQVSPVKIVDYMLKTDKTVSIQQIYDGISDIYGETGVRALLNILSRSKLFEKIPELIVKRYASDSNPKKIIRLLIEFDDLMTAVALIDSTPDTDEFLPLLAKRAAELGKVDTLNVIYTRMKKRKLISKK